MSSELAVKIEMNIDNEKLYDKLRELANKVGQDYLYMYNYNVDVIMSNADTNRKISSLNKKLVDADIENQQLKFSNSLYRNLFWSLLGVNLGTIGVILVCLL